MVEKRISSVSLRLLQSVNESTVLVVRAALGLLIDKQMVFGFSGMIDLQANSLWLANVEEREIMGLP